MDTIIKLCEKGRYQDALRLIDEKEQSGKVSSEHFRVKGQAQMMLGEFDNAINSLIESLRIDPSNESALILVGNIYAQEKSDPKTALSYFRRVLELNTSNYIGLTNIGGIIAKLGNVHEAKVYFKRAIKVNKGHAPAYYGLALAEEENDLIEAFEFARKAVLASLRDSNLNNQCLQLAKNIATKYLDSISGREIYDPFLKKLESQSGKEIDIQIVPDLNVPAKIRIAEYHDLPTHQIQIREDRSSVTYYVLHELMHLKFITEARQIGENEVFVTNESTYQSFRKRAEKHVEDIVKNGVPRASVEKFLQEMYHGLLLQMYNAPIDLFIEQKIFETKEYRPIQFLGLIEMIQPAIQVATDKKLKRVIPPFIRDSNIILTTTQLMLIKELYGIDFLKLINEKNLIKRGEALYSDFKEMQEDKTPAEEYDLVRWWAHDLKLERFFDLHKER